MFAVKDPRPVTTGALVLAIGTVGSAVMFAPAAFAVNASDGAADGANPTTTTAHQPAAGSALTTWQWTLISVGIVAAFASIGAVDMTVQPGGTQTGTLQLRAP